MRQTIAPEGTDGTVPGEPDKRGESRAPYRLLCAFLAGMLLVSVAGGAYIWATPPRSAP